MSDTKKSKRLLVKVKYLNEELVDAAIDDAPDVLSGKDEVEQPEKPVRVEKKGMPGYKSEGNA